MQKLRKSIAVAALLAGLLVAPTVAGAATRDTAMGGTYGSIPSATMHVACTSAGLRVQAGVEYWPLNTTVWVRPYYLKWNSTTGHWGPSAWLGQWIKTSSGSSYGYTDTMSVGNVAPGYYAVAMEVYVQPTPNGSYTAHQYFWGSSGEYSNNGTGTRDLFCRVG